LSDRSIAVTHEVLISTALTYPIFITLSTAGFIEPDFIEGRGPVNYITSFIKFIFCV
jgi:hypothetical protein